MANVSSIVDIYTVGGARVGREHGPEYIVASDPRIGFSPGGDQFRAPGVGGGDQLRGDPLRGRG